MKGEINSNAITIGDFNTTLLIMDRSSRQKISKERLAVNDILDQIDLDEYIQNIPSKTAEHSFFSTEHQTFSKIDPILDNKIIRENFKKFKSYQGSFLSTTV